MDQGRSRYELNSALLEGRRLPPVGTHKQYRDDSGRNLKWERRGYGPIGGLNLNVTGVHGNRLDEAGFELFGIPRLQQLSDQQKAALLAENNHWDKYFQHRGNDEDLLEEARQLARVGGR